MLSLAQSEQLLSFPAAAVGMGLLDSVVEGVPLSKVICTFVGVFYPCIASFNAVRAASPSSSKTVGAGRVADDAAAAVAAVQLQWLVYWMVAGLFLLAESVFDLAAGWGSGGSGSGVGVVTLYYEAKTIFVIWLTLPGFDGAALLYRKYLAPFLAAHEGTIDAQIARAGGAAGAQLERARAQGGDFLRTKSEDFFRAASGAATGMLAQAEDAEGGGVAAVADDKGTPHKEATGMRRRGKK